MSEKVIIIVVTWNKKDYVLNLISQLYENVKYPEYDILIVDNASNDGTQEAVTSKFRDIIYIRNKENLGGTGGFNTGLKFVLNNKEKYKYIWLLDNDVELINDPLSPAIEILKNDKSIGVVGSSILSQENKEIITEIGGLIVKKNRILGNCKGRKLNECNEIYEVDYVASCSAFLKVKVLEKVGIWDDYYFIYFDDVDFFWRIKNEGYKIIATKKSIVSHPDFVEKSNIFGGYYYMRNSFYFFLKKYKLGKLSAISFFKYKVFYIVFDLIRGDKKNFIAMTKAIENYFKGERGKSLWIEIFLKRTEHKSNFKKKLDLKRIDKIVFSYSTKFRELEKFYKELKKKNPFIRVFFLSDIGRKGLINTIGDIEIIVVDFNKKWKTLKKFFTLLFKEKVKFIFSFKGAFGNFLVKYRVYEKNGIFFFEKNRRFSKWLKFVFIFPILFIFYFTKYNLLYILGYPKNEKQNINNNSNL